MAPNSNTRSSAQFLTQYFSLYDGDNREQLMEAYHEDAVMSMSVAYPSYHTHEVRACNTLKRYLTVGSRNLVRLSFSLRSWPLPGPVGKERTLSEIKAQYSCAKI